MEYSDSVPLDLIQFSLIALFSLLIGLSQRKIHPVNDEKRLFGTDRTFTFIGILGYVLFVIEPDNMLLFVVGGAMLTIFLGIYYYHKLVKLNDYGLTTIIIALITYSLAPLLITQPIWLFLLVVVTVLIFTELKESFLNISQKFDKDEFITLGKFLAIAGVILPIVPNEPFVAYLNLTPYKIWLAVVVISSISYFSYLLKKFVFKDAGIIISGVLGGLYSSTATTIILAKKSREATDSKMPQYAAAIILATAMMYLRIFILALIFSIELFNLLYPFLLVLLLVSLIAGITTLLYKNKTHKKEQLLEVNEKNPLEFKVALLFAFLYVILSFITFFAITSFGLKGLNMLSYVVGLTDIDPFVIGLFQGKFEVNSLAIATACLHAMISNNLLKMVYACSLSKRKMWKYVLISFIIIILINLAIVQFMI